MSVQLQHDRDVCTVTILGRFTFDVNRPFRNLYSQALDHESCRQLDMDLSGVEYLDSAALGMLLLVKERADASKKKIRLCGAQGLVLSILEVARFHEVFDFA